MRTIENIKPCSTCKDSRDIVLLRNDESIAIDGILNFRYSYNVQCTFCGRTTNKHDDPEAAIEEWNRRANE